MADRGDARVVHAFVDDLSTVLAEDIHEWLRIIGDIDELKMQYDVARQRSFYWIRFRQSSAARLAVDHLDGQRLKNQIVEIRSDVFTKRAAGANDAGDVTEEGNGAVANPSLPTNHLMPSDLRMDELLVCAIPDLLAASEEAPEGGELVQKLRELQESYHRSRQSLERATAEIGEVDKELTALLRGQTLLKAGAGGLHGDNDVPAAAPTSSTGIRNALPLPLSTCDPAGLIAKLTRYVGPVVDYAFSLTPDGRSFFAAVELLHPDDARLALRLLTGQRTDKNGSYHIDAEGALSALVGFGWETTTVTGPLTPPTVRPACLTAHSKAGCVLWSCRRVA